MNNAIRASRFLLPLAALSLAGCMLGPDYRRPDDLPVPDAYHAIPAGAAADAPEDAAEERFAGESWWRRFDDPILVDLIADGIANNLSLLQTAQRLRAARASLDEASAALWPSLSASASANASKRWNPGQTSRNYNAGADAGWELDLFGAKRRSSEAAEAEALAAFYTLGDAQVSLAAEIGTEYVNLRMMQAQLEVAQSNLVLQSDSVAIAQEKYDAGFASRLDSTTILAQLETTRAKIPSLEAQIDASVRRLELLTAHVPGALTELLAERGDVPCEVLPPLGAPSDLLRRRPDVRAAEANYQAAVARIGVAEANRYPNFSLSASAMLSATSLGAWSDVVRSVAAGPSANWNFWSFGRNAARVEQAKATAEQSALAYRAAVLGAVHEVESAWTNLDREIARAEALERAYDLQQEALALSRGLYAAGEAEYLEVLSAQSAYLSASETLVNHAAQRAVLAISLYKSLGGGWDE